ncbi:MAG: RNA 2',3'-cyclic phosphodiesterase [Alphaproteobacteria bacterium]|nr:RNA 2',3'-cyclic phosphodiesterase [Alphaproteobacteria bacterium]
MPRGSSRSSNDFPLSCAACSPGDDGRGLGMTRLFVGLALEPSLVDRLTILCGGVPGARWQSAEQLHLTLGFIGEVDGKTFDDVRFALRSVYSSKFDLRIDDIGHFGEKRRVHALWARVPAHPELMALQARIESVLVRYGFMPESRKYKPHITLARLHHSPLDRVLMFLSSNALFSAGPVMVDEFHLFSSHQGRAGSGRSIASRKATRLTGWRRDERRFL